MSELVKKQFAAARRMLFETLEGVSPEVFDTIPEGFNNSIHWQVGHILSSTEFFLFTGKGILPENYNNLFGYGSKPAHWTGDIPSVESLLAELKEQLVRINGIPNETFHEKLPSPVLGIDSVGELAAMGALHECMHLGQIQSLKRLIEATQTQTQAK
ncbi:DinB family protein [Pseudoneobacillus sp. C159]